ncbi:hypothetical protein [Dactylosporangium matsuzakiense]|uniref:Uncharacterized protein n=1 Tax=Dactylosporangium matsuzakiense TaxID=53360 RepID=A0A9W6KIB0_9ACTN|nr:hypothetical protein [Dactylosporangium matsuzakiense]UWZ49758.1 hypothetical protein Dmats_25600 [Dactylosporangium matsuzakiense]GLL01009.1 hypothetical protein GCM10017581_027500 [Dactylosporangium matsuzakiense]
MTIHDETATGRVLGSLELDLPAALTLRELIRLRVREEVAQHNAQAASAAERVDWEPPAGAAVAAFGRNAFFVLVGDRQVEDLDAPLTLDEASRVAFVRLVPLVGG